MHVRFAHPDGSWRASSSGRPHHLAAFGTAANCSKRHLQEQYDRNKVANLQQRRPLPHVTEAYRSRGLAAA